MRVGSSSRPRKTQEPVGDAARVELPARLDGAHRHLRGEEPIGHDHARVGALAEDVGLPTSRFLTDRTVVPHAAATRRMVEGCAIGCAIKSWDRVGSRRVRA